MLLYNKGTFTIDQKNIHKKQVTHLKRTITYDQTIDIGYIYLLPVGIGTIKEPWN
ncbi:hypothetical protein ACEQPO_04590 [Bacillus sp. SL00103]